MEHPEDAILGRQVTQKRRSVKRHKSAIVTKKIPSTISEHPRTCLLGYARNKMKPEASEGKNKPHNRMKQNCVKLVSLEKLDGLWRCWHEYNPAILALTVNRMSAT